MTKHTQHLNECVTCQVRSLLVGLLDLQSPQQTRCALQLLADLVDGNSEAAVVVMSSGAKLFVKACCKQLPLDRLLINKSCTQTHVCRTF